MTMIGAVFWATVACVVLVQLQQANLIVQQNNSRIRHYQLAKTHFAEKHLGTP
ncbi:hypothetical protein [Fructilactobacillus florum]|uniref:hypothetical protein n=1 Tax=Fructilactobacillus florum TaxID=640331 RepID=UPI0012DE4095|nr:hypothetical protein [Fructilactobacillus florum]